MSEESFGLEYLDSLSFFDNHFVYEDEEIDYDYIRSINYTSIATKHSVNFVPTGTTYETNLYLIFQDGDKLKIQQESSFLRLKQKDKSQAIMRASAIFHEITFTKRMEAYENQLNKVGYVTWGNYQFKKIGDLFHKHEFLFNLKDEKVDFVVNNVFSIHARKKPSGFKDRMANIFKGDHIIGIATDRDCFFYFMKHYVGLSWRGEQVREKRKAGKQEFNEALLILGAKICKADGRVSPEEIVTFKTYFGIDEKSFPNSAKIFADAVNSTQKVEEPARKIYNLFNDNREPLEYIIIGLIKIAAADGIITASERALIESIGHEFSFSKAEIDRFFVIFKQSNANTNNRSASSSLHEEYLQILGLGKNVTFIQIKTAYREMAKKHHPDLLRAKGIPMEKIKDAEDTLKTINKAYQWLSEYYSETEKARA